MVKLRCQDCGGITEGKKSDVDDSQCECGGNVAVLNSDEDEYVATKCSICKKEITKDDDGDTDGWRCEECDKENICEDCIVEFENAETYYCIDCVREACPSLFKTETKVEYQDRIVEKEVKVYVDKDGTPIDISFNPAKKSKFD